MRHRLFVHVGWTTRDRERCLDAPGAAFLASFLPAIARQERARVLAMGIVSSHVHLLMRLHPETDIPRLLQRLKGGSSVIANREGHVLGRLLWSKGCNLESVSPRGLELARDYVLNPAQRHPDEAIEGWEAGWRADREPVALSPSPV